jgi:hypothetical protein
MGKDENEKKDRRKKKKKKKDRKEKLTRMGHGDGRRGSKARGQVRVVVNGCLPENSTPGRVQEELLLRGEKGCGPVPVLKQQKKKNKKRRRNGTEIVSFHQARFRSRAENLQGMRR